MEQRDKMTAGEIRLQGKFITWLDNFWYHYKWHTIFGVFIFVLVLVCVLQACNRETYDYTFVYAGDYHIFREDEAKMEQSLADYAADKKDGKEVNVALTSYSPMTQGVAKQLEQEIMTGGTVIYFMDPDTFEKYRGDYFVCLDTAFPDIPDGMLCCDGYAIYLRDTELYGMEGLSLLPEDTVIAIQGARYYQSNKIQKYVERCTELFARIALAKDEGDAE